MNTIAVYQTKRGSVEKSLDYLKTKVELEIKNIQNSNEVNLDKYNVIIIANSIHAGRMSKEIVDYIKSNIEIISNKSSYLLINCGDRNNMMDALKINIGNDYIKKFKGIFHGGYAYNLEKMNLFTKFIIKKIAKINESKEFINKEDLERLADTIIKYKEAD